MHQPLFTDVVEAVVALEQWVHMLIILRPALMLLEVMEVMV
jgi:hypothetical protein